MKAERCKDLNKRSELDVKSKQEREGMHKREAWEKDCIHGERLKKDRRVEEEG